MHDFHIYSLGEGKPILSAHVVTDANPSYALYKITELLQQEFEIFHSTIQVEPNKKSHMISNSGEILKCINEHNFLDKHALSVASKDPSIPKLNIEPLKEKYS